jgi:hypothetical protein
MGYRITLCRPNVGEEQYPYLWPNKNGSSMKSASTSPVILVLRKGLKQASSLPPLLPRRGCPSLDVFLLRVVWDSLVYARLPPQPRLLRAPHAIRSGRSCQHEAGPQGITRPTAAPPLSIILPAFTVRRAWSYHTVG